MARKRITLIASLGTTAEPIQEAMLAAASEGAVAVHVAYGRPFLGQSNDPFVQAAAVRRVAEEHGIPVTVREIANPEDFDLALAEFRQVLQGVAQEAADEIIVDYTGGTKVMSAALAHAALTTPVEGLVTLQYVGGPRRDEAGKVTGTMQIRSHPQTIASEAQRRTLELLGRYDYAGAVAQARWLPAAGRSGFLKGAATALRLWDAFQYDEAWQALNEGRLGNQAIALLGDAQLGGLARCLRSLYEELPKLREALPALRRLVAGAKAAPLGERAAEGALTLIADLLENAYRRSVEGRATDAVLRSYRAVEAAVQLAQVQLGMNPWETRSGLDGGLQQLREAGAMLPDALVDRLRALQQARNYSFLEHGYNWLNIQQAGEALATAQELATAVVGAAGLATDIAVRRGRLTHQW